ncbi:MAG: ATP-binding cassette domain-containing protein [Chitinophagaceae bacterium]|nr:ATP-binding cassette domain-containing protein [Chitinophagaceae bacterium]
MKPAIEIRNLGKEYKLMEAEPYLSLRDVLSNTAKNILRGKKKRKNKFWALEDINADIMPGERIGIIGRNGAGKSTLLKIISRITPPTKGEAFLRGRVSSLLEVGTGFHNELTGRENIYLNGSILGLKRKEIKQNLDEIIVFSGVEKFIDTPIKHYSSGMKMRLAFSVAAHLNAEILLIDEVLAVGDIEFQKKCLGKMEEVSQQEGRTILFVSHNMDSIRNFCSKSLLLDVGKIIHQGNTNEVINSYVANHLQTQAQKQWPEGIFSYDKNIKLRKTFLHTKENKITSRFDTTERIGLSFEFEVLHHQASFTHGINLYNQEAVNIFNSHDVITAKENLQKEPGQYKATVWIPGNLLPEGIFTIGIALFSANPVDVMIHEQNVVNFEVFTDFSKSNARGRYAEDFPGIIRPLLDWETIRLG